MNPDPLFLVRLGAEVTIKSNRTRSNFLRRLRRNLRAALAGTGVPYGLEGHWSRIYVRTAAPDALTLLPRVFGISSVSPVDAVVPSNLDEILATGLALYRERVTGKRFAIRARRAGAHSFNSKDIEIRLGDALNPYAARVDLTNPEVQISVDVRERETYFFTRRVMGEGGLPLGIEGRAVALISGGYDSAVAAWLMMKRGIEVDYVFCNLGGDAYERSVLHVVKVLAEDWSWGSRPRLHVVDFAEPMRELRARSRESYWQVVLKRLMYRAATQIGLELRADAIITGEAVGQVSSQTLSNLRAIEPAAGLPLFRPLLGFDKEEIIARAQHIGTAALSEQVREYCAITPGHPVTAATVERVANEEAKLDLSLLDAAVAQRKVLDLRAIDPVEMVAPYLFAADVPAGAVVLDCRPTAQFRSWHLPGAQHFDEMALLTRYKTLDKERTYILYCAHGIQTAYLAEKMQRAGYEAYSFKGGVRSLMSYAEQKGLLPVGLM
jgi:thiamine biosynthesis protein ThiI